MLITAYGEDTVFEAADVEKPEVKAGHVLVNIAASSVNTVDTMIRKMGKELPLSPDTPAILGMDFAGTYQRIAVVAPILSGGLVAVVIAACCRIFRCSLRDCRLGVVCGWRTSNP